MQYHPVIPTQIISRLRSSIAQWTNPMLLPTILMENHMIRSALFAHDLDDRVIAIERQTGVVFAGRIINPKELAIQPKNIPKVSIRKLTQDMHTLLTKIIFHERIVEWSFDCVDSLEKCSGELSKSLLPENRTTLYESNRELLETIEYLAASRKSMSSFQQTSKERVQSQIGVVGYTFSCNTKYVTDYKQLYSFTAQIDNLINAKISVSSARDSSAMKTLALITTVFLPGTYIAVS
jgi:Mg2+ and Co2+ transporter CorA